MPENAVGIVTVTHNSARVIRSFLRSLENQTRRDFTLYVVDNFSHDNTLEIVSEVSFAAVTIVNNSNVGFAEGANQGIRAALRDGCKYILLLNNDTRFGPELLRTLLNELSLHSADMITPKILFDRNQVHIWYAGGFLSAIRGYSGVHYGYSRPDLGRYDIPRRVDFSPACCLLIRSEVFYEIGLLDPAYFLYFEDTDLCYRAHRNKVAIWYTPKATIFHDVGSLTGGATSLIFIRYNTRNHVYFLYKHFAQIVADMFVAAYIFKVARKVMLGQYNIVQARVAWRAMNEGLRLASRIVQEQDRQDGQMAAKCGAPPVK